MVIFSVLAPGCAAACWPAHGREIKTACKNTQAKITSLLPRAALECLMISSNVRSFAVMVLLLLYRRPTKPTHTKADQNNPSRENGQASTKPHWPPPSPGLWLESWRVSRRAPILPQEVGLCSKASCSRGICSLSCSSLSSYSGPRNCRSSAKGWAKRSGASRNRWTRATGPPRWRPRRKRAKRSRPKIPQAIGAENMARPEIQQTAPETVDTILMYIVDTGEKPVSNSAERGAKPVHTGTYAARPATIRNARLLREPPTLEREGFTLVDHETKVANFYNEDEIRAVYYPEMERLIAAESGATRVVIFDHTLRAENDATRAEKQVREPVRRVHNDYTEWSGPQRVRDLLPAEAEDLLKRRFAVIQTWRPIRNPVVTAPLAIADARSLPIDDMIPTERRYPDRVGGLYQLGRAHV